MITALRLWVRLLRHQPTQRLSTSLAVVAFGTAAAGLLIVVGGWQAFEARSHDPARSPTRRRRRCTSCWHAARRSC